MPQNRRELNEEILLPLRNQQAERNRISIPTELKKNNNVLLLGKGPLAESVYAGVSRVCSKSTLKKKTEKGWEETRRFSCFVELFEAGGTFPRLFALLQPMTEGPQLRGVSASDEDDVLCAETDLWRVTRPSTRDLCSFLQEFANQKGFALACQEAKDEDYVPCAETDLWRRPGFCPFPLLSFRAVRSRPLHGLLIVSVARETLPHRSSPASSGGGGAGPEDPQIRLPQHLHLSPDRTALQSLSASSLHFSHFGSLLESPSANLHIAADPCLSSPASARLCSARIAATFRDLA
jgi:hypothetical protein